jgi:imidazolonepropionase-like amidohydrolase
MVDEAHRAGITAQAHAISVEGLRIAVEAGCDLITHANISGPVPIPQDTLDLMAKRGTGAVIFPHTERGLVWLKENGTELGKTMWGASDVNARNMIRSGAPLLLANDGMVFPPEWTADPRYKGSWTSAPAEFNLGLLATGHFVWFEAMEEKGCAPMAMLKAATKNIALAYKKDKDLGTLEKGKIADLVVLDKDPLRAAANYRSIHMVIKGGSVVDRDVLPANPVLTRAEPPAEEEAYYVAALGGGPHFPHGGVCM